MRDIKITKYKKDFDYSYAFGMFPTIELLNQKPKQIIKVMLSDEANKSSELKTVIELCRKNKIRFEFNDKQISRIAVKENTYAVCAFNKYKSSLVQGENHMVLVNPSDMGNVGTIVRTMLGFGIRNLALIRPAVDIFDPKVVRTSMGALFGLHFEYFDSFENYIKKYPTQHVYTFMLQGDKELKEVKFEKPMSLVFGNEGQGLNETYKNLGQSVFIKHESKIDSLNLGIAAGIALYYSKD